MNVAMTQHAGLRCSQRRVRPEDLKLALRIGTPTDDGVLVRETDVQTQVAELKRQITCIERLKGLYIACPGDAVVTSDPGDLHRLLDHLRVNASIIAI